MLALSTSRRLLLVVVLAGSLLTIQACGHLKRARLPISHESRFRQLAKDMDSLEAIEGIGTLRVERGDESIDLPFRLTLSKEGLLSIEAEVNHMMFPLEGKLTLVSDRDATLVYTDIGVFDLAEDIQSQSSFRALMFSLFGGGNWLVVWLMANGCDPAKQVECEDLEVSLEFDDKHNSIERWKIQEIDGEASFSGWTYEFDPGCGLLPRIVTGILYPHRISLFVEYDEIHKVMK